MSREILIFLWGESASHHFEILENHMFSYALKKIITNSTFDTTYVKLIGLTKMTNNLAETL